MRPAKSHNQKFIRIRQRIKAQMHRSVDRGIRTKAELILLALKLGNISEACQRRGFSTKFYYTWWGRFKKAKFDLKALKNEAKTPKRSPKKIDRKLEIKIHHLKLKHGYGSRMIEGVLRREGIKISRSVICHVLNERKKIKKTKTERLKAHRRRYELNTPGERVQLDVKYIPHPIAGLRAYNFVAIDECTRLRFAWGYFDLSPKSTIDFLDKLIKVFPFKIHCIQTDNGFEFTNRFSDTDKIHAMDLWCQKHGIRHRCIPPGEKELNGKVERSHRLDEQYFYWQMPVKSLEAFHRAQIRWLDKYNNHRPHGGINFMTPYEKLKERAEILKLPLSISARLPITTGNKDHGIELLDELEMVLRQLYEAA